MQVRDERKRAGRLGALPLLLALLLQTSGTRAAVKDADELRFAIARYQVQGNSLLASKDIERLLQPFSGAERGFSDIEAARERLQQAYQNAGYTSVVVTLPEQTMQDGVVVFAVLEPRLGTINVTGAASGAGSYDRMNILNSLPALSVGQVANMQRVNAQLALANENPGKTTEVTLRKGAQANTIDANVHVQETKAWRAFLTLDNSGNAQTGDFRLGVGYQYANVANRDQVFTAQYQTAPGHLDSVSAYGVGYHLPLYAFGDSIDVFAGYANVDAGTVADLFTVSGKGSVFGVRYNQFLSERNGYKRQLIYGLDYRAYRNDIRFVGVPIGNNVTVHPLSLAYAGRYRTPKAECSFAVTALQNIAGGSHGNNADFELVRVGANAAYRILRSTADCRRSLVADWQIRFKSAGQYAPRPLVPGEQFGLGGLHSVRGFDERQFAGDSGVQASAELYSPELGRFLPYGDANLRGLIFYDFGNLHLNDPQPGDVAHTTIASWGGGLRLGITRRLSFELDYARVLRAGTSDLSGEHRVQGSLTLVF